MAFKIGTTTLHNADGRLLHPTFSAASSSILQNTKVKITASDGSSLDVFGKSVAVGSGRIVVGAYLDDLTPGSNSGSAYIFDLNGTQLAKITASDGAAADYFGYSVAVGSGRIVVGAYLDDDNGDASGSAYIYDLNGNQIAKIKPSDGAAGDYFGVSVAIGCGKIVVGAEQDDDNGINSGSAYIYDINGTQLFKIKASDGVASDGFGKSVAVGSGRIVVGVERDADNGSFSGSAYIFSLNGIQIAKIKPSDGAAGDHFGRDVAVGSGRIVVGAYGDDDNGSYSGSAYIFDLNGTQLAKIKASDGAASDYFGYSVAVGSGRIVVGAYKEDTGYIDNGAAYTFDLNGNQLAKITPSDLGKYFGYSVAVGSGRICVGAYSDDVLGTDSGSAYIYDLGENYDSYIEDKFDK